MSRVELHLPSVVHTEGIFICVTNYIVLTERRKKSSETIENTGKSKGNMVYNICKGIQEF